MSTEIDEPTPFWQKTLDDYSDDMITRATPSGEGWYAVLDVGFNGGPGDPDFATYGGTREKAVAAGALRIRQDAKGIGKFAPHSILVSPYDLHFKLCKHWEFKQRAVDIGLDPHEFMSKAFEDGKNWSWHLEGEWLAQCTAHRQLEAFSTIVLGEMEPLIRSGDDPELGAIEARSKFSLLVRDETYRIRPTEKTMLELERRIQERIVALEPDSTGMGR